MLFSGLKTWSSYFILHRKTVFLLTCTTDMPELIAQFHLPIKFIQVKREFSKTPPTKSNK